MSDGIRYKVKVAIYEMIVDTGAAPTSWEVARKIEIDEGEMRAAFLRLHAKRLLVPEPGDFSCIRMAPPFSGVPTSFPVEANGKRYYANCLGRVWNCGCAPLGRDLSRGRRSNRRTLNARDQKWPARLAAVCRALRRAGRALVGRYRFYLSDHASLPVGRNGRSLVQARGIPKRPLINLEQLWQLAVHWYANRLTVESRRPAADEMVSIFASIGLTGPFWDPKSDACSG